MIKINDVQFSYDQDSFFLKVDELSIKAGQRVVWTGHSGSGKTTLLHLVAGIVQPSAGHIKSCGVDVTSLRDSARRDFRIANIGLVFQDFALFKYLTVLDNILLPYRINHSLKLDKTVHTRAKQLATDLGLDHLLLRRPVNLSHGERQRVAVCRALVANPKLVLADEPTANLDPENASRVLDALDRHVEDNDATLVVVTHDHDLHARFDHTIDISSFSHQIQTASGGDFSDKR